MKTKYVAFSGQGGFIGSSTAMSTMPNSRLTATLSAPISSGVDQMVLVTTLFNRAVTGLTASDYVVTNGTCVYVSTLDNITWIAHVYPGAASSMTVSLPASVVTSVIGSAPNTASNTVTITTNSDWVSLSTPSFTKAYYDFREGVGLNTDTITLDDPLIRDLSGNNRTLSLINTPALRARGASEPGIVGLRDTLTQCASIGSTGAGIFDRNFRIVFAWQSNNGVSGVSYNMFGNTDVSGNKGVIFTINATGQLLLAYQSNTLGFVWTSTSAVTIAGQTPVMNWDIKFDFTNDVLTVLKDGVAVAGSFTTRDIASTDPTTYAATTDFYIGSLNTSGTAGSNSNTNSIYYFAITDTTGTNTISTYLANKKATIELVSTLTDATYLKNPHYPEFSPDRTKALVSGKGATSATNVDGSFGIIDISNPAAPVMLGGYSGHADQIDGETIYVHSSTRALHFVNGGVILFDYSNPAAPSLLRTVSHASGANSVGNGYAIIGNCLFSANKAGYIDVFDITTIDSFTLIGSCNVGSLFGMTGPHDPAVSPDGNHLIFVSRSTGAQLGIIKVFNAGVLIPIASWTLLASITSATIAQANRVHVFGNTAVVHCLDTGGDAIVTVDVTTIGSPSILDSFSLTSPTANASGSAGKGRYRGKYCVTATWLGVRLLDVTTNPSNISQGAGYMNATTFTAGTNQNFHECPTFVNNGSTYIFMTCQNDGIAIFKINDRLG